MRTTVYIATSLDGFIARADGAIDWLPTPDGGQDYGYAAFFASVDVLVMGRATYETVQTFGAWPYEQKAVVVLSHRPVPIAPALTRVEAMSGAPAEILARLQARGHQHAYIDGGKTVQAFIGAGLVDRLIVTRIPVLLGAGLPLFGPVPADVRLRHVATRSFPDGLVQSEYELPRPT